MTDEQIWNEAIEAAALDVNERRFNGYDHDLRSIVAGIRELKRAKLSPQPTFAHSLAGYLTRNGQVGDWTEMEKEIDQFMGDSKLEVTRAT